MADTFETHHSQSENVENLGEQIYDSSRLENNLKEYIWQSFNDKGIFIDRTDQVIILEYHKFIQTICQKILETGKDIEIFKQLQKVELIPYGEQFFLKFSFSDPTLEFLIPITNIYFNSMPIGEYIKYSQEQRRNNIEKFDKTLEDFGILENIISKTIESVYSSGWFGRNIKSGTIVDAKYHETLNSLGITDFSIDAVCRLYRLKFGEFLENIQNNNLHLQSFDDKKQKSINEALQKYARIMASIGDDVEGMEFIMKRSEEEMKIIIIYIMATFKTSDEILDFMQSELQKIDENTNKITRGAELNEKYMQEVFKASYNRLIGMKDYDDSKYLRYCRIISGRETSSGTILGVHDSTDIYQPEKIADSIISRFSDAFKGGKNDFFVNVFNGDQDLKANNYPGGLEVLTKTFLRVYSDALKEDVLPDDPYSPENVLETLGINSETLFESQNYHKQRVLIYFMREIYTNSKGGKDLSPADMSILYNRALATHGNDIVQAILNKFSGISGIDKESLRNYEIPPNGERLSEDEIELISLLGDINGTGILNFSDNTRNLTIFAGQLGFTILGGIALGAVTGGATVLAGGAMAARGIAIGSKIESVGRRIRHAGTFANNVVYGQTIMGASNLAFNTRHHIDPFYDLTTEMAVSLAMAGPATYFAGKLGIINNTADLGNHLKNAVYISGVSMPPELIRGETLERLMTWEELKSQSLRNILSGSDIFDK